MKPNTIADEYEADATLSAWLRCYPFMRQKPRLWGLHKVAVSPRCRALYPDVILALQNVSRPRVINFAVPDTVSIAA